jgi:predicted O-methyltransferase YrrM
LPAALNAIFHKFPHAKARIKDNLPIQAKGHRDLLAEVYCDLGYTRGAEIGTRRGRYAKILCDKNPFLKLYCIDPWNDYVEKYPQARQDLIYQEALEALKGCNVEIIRKTSMDALADIEDRSLDFVFIDGNHEFDYVAPDIVFWSKKVKHGGIVSVHDYYHFHLSGVMEAVDAYTKCHRIDPWFTTKNLEPTAFWINP